MAIPNVNQITSTLRNMPDQQLQQYAALHKGDPYVLSLAIAESNARKQLRAAQQAKMAGQQQPTVADQSVAQMAQLPETQGIGALPAPNLQGMADGGIVGYNPGYSVGGTAADDGEDSVRMAEGGIARFADTGYVQSTPLTYGEQMRSLGDFMLSIPRRIVSDPSLAAEEREKEAKKSKGSSKLNAERDAAMSKVVNEGYTRPGMENDPRLTGPIPKEEKKQTALEKATADNAAAAPARTPAGPAASAPSSSPSTLGQYTPKTAEDLMGTARELAKEANKDSETAYKPYAEMLQKERAELEGRKQSNVNDALLRAGLAMMAGKSQHALQNIGEGGIQGVNAYQEARRLDDAAKKALMGSEIAMMQAQRAERSGNHKDAVAIMGQAEQGQQFATNAAMKAEEIRNNRDYQQGSLANQRAQISLGASKLDLMRDAYGIKEKQIIAKYASQAENNLAKQDPLWNTYSDVLKQQKVQSAMRTLLSADPNYAHLASNIGFTPTANSSLVRTLNKDDE